MPFFATGVLMLVVSCASLRTGGIDAILLVANKHSNTLSFVDRRSLKVLTTIPTGPNPHEIVVTPDQKFACLSNYAPPGNLFLLLTWFREDM